MMKAAPIALFTLGCSLALGGCEMPTQEDMLQSYRQTCEAYGLTFGTPEFAQCMSQQSQQQAAAAQALAANWRHTPATPYVMPNNRPTTTNCSPDYMGGMTCRSY